MAYTTKHSISDYESNPFLATEILGHYLAQGKLSLFLGAGLSLAFGLPNWLTLIGRILGKDGDAAFMEELKKKSTIDQIRLIDSLDDGTTGFINRVHDALYQKVETNLLEELQRSPLLLAVVALLTGSCRGRIPVVVTYNYDNLLEQYLKMLGHKVCIRTKFTDYSSWADVEINHVHGYLPQGWPSEKASSELILSDKAYRKRRANIDDGWPAQVENLLYQRVPLLLCLSGSDGNMHDIFERAKSRLKQRVEDYHGYWVLTPEHYKENSPTITDIGMCPIPLAKEKLPQFIFNICQKAVT